MEPRRESSDVGALLSAASRNISSSSSAFVSASQSPFFSPPSPPENELQQGYWDYRVKEKKAGKRRVNPPPPQPPAVLSSSAGNHGGCDVYLGFHGRKPSLLRFAKWVRAELETHGISCISADRARCKNARSRDRVERSMKDAAFGVVILSRKSFANSLSVEELGSFLERKNLVPVFFDLRAGDCLSRDVVERRGDVWERHGGELWTLYGGDERAWRDAVDGLARLEGPKLEAREGNWRDCVVQLVLLLAANLGRRSAAERINRWRKMAEKAEFPFPRQENFVGRKKELSELELLLYGDTHSDAQEFFELKTRRRRRNPTAGGKGKEPLMWKESERDIEMQKIRTKGSGRATRMMYGKGIACVSGQPGIGKTELLLEFAYRFSQRYKMVLWIAGESRYLRQSYLNLKSFLEVDVGVESSNLERGTARCLEEQEEEAIARVRRELMQDIPYLIVVDNLESEEDWFDQKSVMDLLPRFGGETHVLISTRLPRLMNLEPMKLSYLSGVEAMALMRGSREDYPVGEVDALRTMEEKLGRFTLGLSVVGSILSELPITPSRLLDTINRSPVRFCGSSDGGDHFLAQLIDVCLSIFNHASGRRSLAARMVQVSGWFAPGPVPISLLALAANKILEKKDGGGRIWRRWTSSIGSSEAEASSVLIRFRIARACAKSNCIRFPDSVKLHARRIAGGDGIAAAALQAITLRATVSLHPEQIWAGCFLLFGFRAEPMAVELQPSELLCFVKRAALPLAVHTFIAFSRCVAALELLRLCTAALDAAAETLISERGNWHEGPICCAGASRSKKQTGMWLWRELGLLRAAVLETRAKLMLRGAQYDAADELIRKTIFIRTSISGENHPATVAARETLSKLTRLLTDAHHS